MFFFQQRQKEGESEKERLLGDPFRVSSVCAICTDYLIMFVVLVVLFLGRLWHFSAIGVQHDV